MKKLMKKSLAVVLALVMLTSTFVCFAAELNQDAVNAHYGQYKNYLLLGDSVASGFRDEITDADYDYNKSYKHTTYYRVPGSYADVLANAIVEDKSMTALAAPGFRTIEMRYMLEDDYMAECADDPFLFHPFQLYAYKNEICDCHGEAMLPGSEHFREIFKKSIAEADLITLGIGGNDWGAYLSWVVNQIFEEENVADEYTDDLEALLNGTMDISTIETVIDLAHKAGALPTLLERLPEALEYGLGNFYKNWEIVIQDIYALNPDVTLMVLGMSDNSLKGNYYSYDGTEGAPVNPDAAEEDATKAQAMSLIIDFIMGVGNLPLKEYADDYGYRYVDTDGATYVDSHPDAAGHVYIANKIIEALPSKEVFNKFEDITPASKYYDVVEYVITNGIMTGKTDSTFAPDEAITKGEFAAALNAINGTDKATDKDTDATVIHVAFALIGAASKKDAAGFFKTLALAMNVIFDSNANFGASVSRIAAAQYLMTYSNI